VQLFRCRSC